MANLVVNGVIKEKSKRVLSSTYVPAVSATSVSYTAEATSGTPGAGQYRLSFVNPDGTSNTSGTRGRVAIALALSSHQAVSSVSATGENYSGSDWTVTQDNQRVWVLAGYSVSGGILYVNLDRRTGDTTNVTTVRICYTVVTVDYSLPTDTSVARLNVTGTIFAEGSRVRTAVPDYEVYSKCEVSNSSARSGTSTTLYLYPYSSTPGVGEIGWFLTGFYVIGRTEIAAANNNDIWQLNSLTTSNTSSVTLTMKRQSNEHESPVRYVWCYVGIKFTS